jgi:hypothetical protein
MPEGERGEKYKRRGKGAISDGRRSSDFGFVILDFRTTGIYIR